MKFRSASRQGIDRPPGSIGFVEDKSADWKRVQELLKVSSDAGQWTNFGPVQHCFAEIVA